MTNTPCTYCAQPSHRGPVCNACQKAKSRNRLHLRLARVCPQPVPVKPRPVSALGPGVCVRLLADPPCFGSIRRRERDGWIVWVNGYGLMKCLPKELAEDRRRR